jgi:hypothetical protein
MFHVRGHAILLDMISGTEINREERGEKLTFDEDTIGEYPNL